MEPPRGLGPQSASITYKQLGVLSFAFALGVVVALVICNASTATSTTNFTTTEIIGFVLTVILSGASIVLAIAAISLGKTSEQAVIRRSDESIRLQNEVFTRTTEALQRIEASTGVTEKRIEDIISGRVGDISHRIAELATEPHQEGRKSFDELEGQIRESIIQTLRTERDMSEYERERELRRKKRLEREEKEKEYLADHEKLMHALCNRDDLKVEKAGHGTSGTVGPNLFDGLFFGEKFRLGISTFRKGTSPSSICAFLSNAVVEIKKGTVDIVLVIQFTEETKCSLLEEASTFLDQLRQDVANRFLVLATTPQEAPVIVEKLKFSNTRLEIPGDLSGRSQETQA
jgi:hypothetical protein